MKIRIYALKKWQMRIPKWLYWLFRIKPTFTAYDAQPQGFNFNGAIGEIEGEQISFKAVEFSPELLKELYK